MRVLKFGDSGVDVENWQYFLRGLREDSSILIDGKFGNQTVEHTKQFQRLASLNPDGIVSNTTIAEALRMGFKTLEDSDDGLPQNIIPRLSSTDRIKLFGNIDYTPLTGENIKVSSKWINENIEYVYIPQLVNKVGVSKDLMIPWNKKCVEQLKGFFAAIEGRVLTDKILTWHGSWVPRFVRGSRTTLSNHAWGTAFDINAQWNGLGIIPTKKNQKGSVVELVELANEWGFYWGGGFSRPDGMHFEIATIL